MRKKRNQHVRMLLIAVAWLGLAGAATPVLSQDLVCCDIFIDADGKWFGARRDCKAALQELSPASRSSACEQIRKGRRPIFRPFTNSASAPECCPEVAELCGHVSPTCKPTTPEAKCEKPTPWSDTSSSSGCKNVQDTQVTIDQKTATATVSMCGYTVFTSRSDEFVGKDEMFRTAYTAAFKDTFPKKICCDKFQEAVRTGKPCDPRADMDCDGKSNQSDADSKSGFPNFDNFSRLDGAPIAPFLGSEPDPPPAGKCDCKWELVKGTAICSPDGKQPHYYEARWKCPSTGNERYTRTAAPATNSCP